MQERLTQSILRPYQSQAHQIDRLAWTEQYRRFNDLPPEIPAPLRHIYQDMHPEIVILKAAQIFISEFLINTLLWVADTGWAQRGNALYVMPTQTHMDDFSKGRIATAIEQSPHLRERVTQTNSSSSIRMRQIAGRSAYLRGSETVSSLRTVDADLVINDEVDLFTPGSIEKSKERLGSSRQPLFIAASQPTYPEVGIDLLFSGTDKRKWFIPCNHCGKEQTLTWDDNVNFDEKTLHIDVVCRFCRRSIDRFVDGYWEPTNDKITTTAHGYHLSKLYSPRANLQAMLERFLAVDDIEKTQSFYTADLGIPYRPRGSKAAAEDFEYQAFDFHKQVVTDCYFGVDVGATLNLSILGRKSRGDNLAENPFYLIDNQVLAGFDDLESFWRLHRPKMTVVDAKGDPRATMDWVEKHPGRAYRHEHVASYTDPKFTDDDAKVRQDRTAMLDEMFSWMRQHWIILHPHTEKLFIAQMTAPVREIVRSQDGRLVPRYIGERADHYAFSTAYAVLAAKEFSVGSGGPSISTAEKSGSAALPTNASTGGTSRIMGLRPSWSGITRHDPWKR